MRAPLSWLRDFAPLDAPVDTLISTLSGLGLVVEGVTRVGGELPGVVVARVLSIRPHPDADRIRLVDVDAGGPETLQIACGAWNFDEGDLVPLATIGTVLPGGMEIGRRKMRGQWSEGMLCAADELELPEPASDGSAADGSAADGQGGAPRGLMILSPGLAEPGTPLADALELTQDVVFDLDITPNRPDAMCIAGVARDLAAALGEPFKGWEPGARPGSNQLEGPGSVASVQVLDPDLCPRFTATVIADVPSGPSPAWLARRLTLAGMRPISAVVDVSNYVMLELGQPNHPYDLDRLPGRGLIVRRARPGETLVTLDDVERRLSEDDCLICDAEDRAVGIGGIMGGAAAEITASTSTVLLEAAWFSPQAIARTGKRLGLSTEARARFERGVDPTVALHAVERFVSLLGDGARRGPTVDVASPAHLPQPPTVAVRTPRVNALLGVELSDADVGRLLRPIGFDVTAAGEGRSEVRVPPWRPDTTREVDVIEEIGRLHGYHNIERTLPPGVRTGGGLSAYQKARREVRDILAGTGLSEAWTTTFLAPEDLQRAALGGAAVEVENPLDRAESILRTSLLPGLLKAVRYNSDRQIPDVRLFEIGRVFLPPAAGEVLPAEREDVAAVIAGGAVDARDAVRVWAALAGALRLEAVRLQAGAVPGLHPTRSAELVGAAGETIGAVGEVDPSVLAAFGLGGRVGFFWAGLESLLAEPRRPERAAPVSRFPASDIDLAFVVPGTVTAASVAATLCAAGGDLLESLRLFDVYPLPDAGEGARSLAFRLRFRAVDRTLTDSEVSEARAAAIAAVAAGHGAELRG